VVKENCNEYEPDWLKTIHGFFGQALTDQEFEESRIEKLLWGRKDLESDARMLNTTIVYALQNQLEDKTSANSELLAITCYEMDCHSKFVNSNEYNMGSTLGASR
jgi:hypothetical protein